MKNNRFARFAAAALSLAILAGCGGGASQSTDSSAADSNSADAAELTVFAAASMTETLNRIAEDYKAVAPNVTLTFNFASSGDLLTQIKEGADCDVFISAAPKQMNTLDGSLIEDTDKNPDGLDELLERLPKNRRILFCGDGLSVHAQTIVEAMGERAMIAPANLRDLRADAVCALAERRREEWIPAQELRPVYLRAPQAERERNARLNREGKA